MSGQHRAIHATTMALLITAWAAADASSAKTIPRPHYPSQSVQQTNTHPDLVGGNGFILIHEMGSEGGPSRLATLNQKISGYEAQLANHPRLYSVWAKLGEAYREKSRLQSSLADQSNAERALERSLAVTGNAVAWRSLAAVRLDQHRFPEAAALARQAIDYWPEDGLSRAILSSALLAMGKYDEGRAVFDGQSQNYYSIVERSHWLFLTGKPEAAIAQLDKALAILEANPSAVTTQLKAWCQLMIGSYRYELDEASKAKEAYKRALSLDPEGIDVLDHIAQWEATYGSKKTAARMYRYIIAAIPRPKEKFALGALLVDLGFSEEGKTLISEAIASWRQRLGQGDISVRRELALALLDHTEDAQQGLGLARADLELRQDALAYDTLAWALYKTGALDEAKLALGQALKYGTPYRILREHAKSVGLPLVADQAR